MKPYNDFFILLFRILGLTASPLKADTKKKVPFFIILGLFDEDEEVVWLGELGGAIIIL